MSKDDLMNSLSVCERALKATVLEHFNGHTTKVYVI